jgi:hypothetical protein
MGRSPKKKIDVQIKILKEDRKWKKPSDCIS